MSGQRSEGQTMIGCWCESSFVAKIDQARGLSSRSQFCRDALAEKLRTAHGMSVELHEQFAPDRTGKGGPTPKPVSYKKKSQTPLK